MFPPQSVSKERRLVWLVYVLLVAAFIAYAVALGAVTLDKRSSGDMATSVTVVKEQYINTQVDTPSRARAAREVVFPNP
jgi:hypothetical protein